MENNSAKLVILSLPIKIPNYTNYVANKDFYMHVHDEAFPLFEWRPGKNRRKVNFRRRSKNSGLIGIFSLKSILQLFLLVYITVLLQMVDKGGHKRMIFRVKLQCNRIYVKWSLVSELSRDI